MPPATASVGCWPASSPGHPARSTGLMLICPRAGQVETSTTPGSWAWDVHLVALRAIARHGAAALLLRIARLGFHLALRAADAARVRPVLYANCCSRCLACVLPTRMPASAARCLKACSAVEVQGVRHPCTPETPIGTFNFSPEGRLAAYYTSSSGLSRQRVKEVDPGRDHPSWVERRACASTRARAAREHAGPPGTAPARRSQSRAPQPPPGSVRE